MTPDDPVLDRIAAAIADGTAIDWAAAEAGADGPRRDIVRELRVISGIADAHETGPLPQDDHPAAPRTAAATASEPGFWGPLRLLEKIGEGSYGDVFRAWDPRLDREVALKIVPAAPAPGRRGTSFIEEGRLLARLRHPNVVTIYGAEEIGDQVGLWMELVRGRTLEQLLKAGVRFDAGEATRISLEVCRAVSAVHAAGLLHRDIKAHNVMVADDGRVVLMDFGAGRELQSGSPQLAGTPLYLAPEVLSGEPASVQSDIYSIGVLLFRLFTGAYPVAARSTAEVRQAHERHARLRVRAINPEVPAAVARVVERAIDAAPRRRYRTVDALAADLASIDRRPWRWRATYAALSAAVILLLTGLGWSGRPSSTGAGGSPPVIGVLPFVNLSPQRDTDAAADGLTLEIQRHLANIDGLELRAADSSFAFRKQPRNIADIGSQLDADYLLDGSVLLFDRKVRVVARLFKVAGNRTVWANRFERDADDLSGIVDQISLEIVDALRLKLGRGQRRYDLHPDMYYRYLQASGLRAVRNAQYAAAAAELLATVVEREPEFAPAWAVLASALADATRHVSPREEMPALDPRMEPAAREALRLDGHLAEAHAAMGSVYARRRDWANARQAFETALTLNPSLTTTHTDFALTTLIPMGLLEEAVTVLEAARRADPSSLDVRRVLSLAQLETGRYEAAIENSRWVLARDAAFPYAALWLARALIFVGEPEEALAILEKRAEDWGYLGYLYAVTGRRDEAEALASKHPDSPGRQMLIYGGLRDKDRAFDALERMAALNWWRAATWMIRPEMEVLRGDPRVADLRRRLGLPPLPR